MAVIGDAFDSLPAVSRSQQRWAASSRRDDATEMSCSRESSYAALDDDEQDGASANSIEEDERNSAHGNELRNLQSVIHVTRENIDLLNNRFASFQHPPDIYLIEYQELTSKLHELEGQFNRLLGAAALAAAEDDREKESSSLEEKNKETTRTSPVKSLLRAHLPNQQITLVQVREGLSLRDALAKAMKLRFLTVEMCKVYNIGTGEAIPWDWDIASLDCDEVSVEILDKFPITTSISHNFVRKTFFTLAFCECCRKLLFHGFLCRTCNYKFHQRCAAGVPPLCHQVLQSLKTLLRESKVC